MPEQARIWDFESGTDTLVVLFDALQDAPEITISQYPDTEDQWLVLANGNAVAQVSGDAPKLADISLMQRT